MEIPLEVKIKDLDQENLVDLISTATYGNNNFGIEYPKEYYKEHLKDEEDCWEDKIAKCLLAGQSIVVSDLQSESEDDVCGELPHVWNKSRETVDYTVNLKDIIKGLENALESKDEYKRNTASRFVFNTDDFDMEDADILFQIIVYGDYIYG